MKRRTFLTHSLGMLGVGATTARLPRPDAEGLAQNARRDGAEAVRIGGPIFVDTTDPEELAQAHRRLGYRAAYCPKVDVKDTARVTAIADAFRTEGVVIAEVGRWVNLLDPDADQRRVNLATVTEGLALAEAVGALCCVDIAGSFSRDVWFGPHPDNLSDKFFDAAVENARTIIRPRSEEVMTSRIFKQGAQAEHLRREAAADRPAGIGCGCAFPRAAVRSADCRHSVRGRRRWRAKASTSGRRRRCRKLVSAEQIEKAATEQYSQLLAQAAQKQRARAGKPSAGRAPAQHRRSASFRTPTNGIRGRASGAGRST